MQIAGSIKRTQSPTRTTPRGLAARGRRLSAPTEIRERLCAAGCDTDLLEAYIILLPAFTGRRSLSLRELDRLVRDCRSVAAGAARFNAQVPGWILLNRFPDLLRLPDLVRLYISVIRQCRPWFDKRRHGVANVPLAMLMAYVHTATGRHHDQDVADLINDAVVGMAWTDHDARTWRSEHRELLQAATAHVLAKSRGTTSVKT
jgi:hypothetical protein